jgi:hypothetical protein
MGFHDPEFLSLAAAEHQYVSQEHQHSAEQREHVFNNIIIAKSICQSHRD